MSIAKILAAKAEFTPESGFNVVALDSFELPGDELYLVSHHDDREDAESAAREYRDGEGAGEQVFVYGPPED